ncbi:MAG: sigma-70 family RNA polymerase sigma factor [Candidatus Cloacimonetes bacterium]|nr:sigma-70 family RNA polymerase sigma factor [Candidatus Cloacimonadota bacterium]MBL7148879.1 sigma-70 family RNA polymerase sigma factor [Candidatus Cloacimonadota bacterium]
MRFFKSCWEAMDRNRFEVILRAENKKIFNYLLKILRHREDAEDILQETFIAFHKKMVVVSDESYISYLFRTAHNKALNFIKVRQKRNDFSSNYSDMEQIPDSENSQPAEEENPNNKIIRKAISKLPEKYALLLEMQFYRKMSYKEIALAMDITAGAVDSRLVRAKKKLKKIISQDMNDPAVLKNRGKKNERERMQIFEKA